MLSAWTVPPGLTRPLALEPSSLTHGVYSCLLLGVEVMGLYTTT